MRYRLMASYLGASYQAAVGPSDRDVTLFAAPPPPEEHGFSPAPGGIWRKQVRLDDLGALWESRPIGSYHGEPCLVLDDLGDRVHIVYLGMDERRAAQLGYWEVDHGVFEVVVPRYDVTDLAEERHEFPIALLLSTLPAASPRALGSGDSVPARPGPSGPGPGPGPGAVGMGPNSAGMAPPGTGRAIGAIGSGGAAGAAAVAGGMGAAAAGQGPGGMAEWNGQSGAPQRARGQLPAGGPAQLPAAQFPAAQFPAAQFPAAMSQPPAPASVQQRVTGAYQAPAGTAFNGVAHSPAPGMPSIPNALGAPGRSQLAELAQLPGGRQLPGGPQGTGLPGVPGGQPAAAGPGQYAQGAPRAQQVPGVALQPPTSAMQLPPGRQLPAAQPPAPQQPLAQQFPPGPPLPAAPQAAAAPQPAAVPQAAAPQPASAQAPQAPQAQAPTTAAAWHGSPAADGNGTWYFQPAADPQQNGAPGAGYALNGLTPNGYAQQNQGTAQASSPNGFGGMQQHPQLVQPAPVTGYQQAPTLPPATATQQHQPGQPGQSNQPPQAGQLTQAAPPAQAMQGPQFAAPSAPPVPAPPAAAPQAPAVPMGATRTGPITAPLAVPAPVASPPVTLQQQVAPQPLSAPLPTTAAPSEASATGPRTSLPTAPQTDQGTHSGLTAVGALGKLTGAVRGRRAARKPRLAMSAIFADLVDMADIPRSAYAVDEEITGAMCLFKTDGGYEVFSCAEDARHEVRFFEEEEAAYFYLFGVLAAEALRNGRLSPRRG